jgi:hypothetical protein
VGTARLMPFLPIILPDDAPSPSQARSSSFCPPLVS